jgi:hypothetical protein
MNFETFEGATWRLERAMAEWPHQIKSERASPRQSAVEEEIGWLILYMVGRILRRFDFFRSYIYVQSNQEW